MGQAESILLDYLEHNNLNYSIGSNELGNYLFEQLMYGKDEILKQEPDYNLILAYAARYISESQGLDNDIPFNMNHISSKTLQAESEAHQSMKGIKYAVPNEGGYNPTTAVSYAARHAYSTSNDTYGYLDGVGGYCTNFASQIVQAGGKSINRPSTITFSTPNISADTSYWYSGIFVTNPNGPT